MKDDSQNVKSTVGTPSEKEGPRAGGVSKKGKTFRVLKCKRDRRVTIRKPLKTKKQEFDPTAWYLYEVQRNKEIACREFLNAPSLGFEAEAYVAVQEKIRRKPKTDEISYSEHVVIHGKIFVRTLEQYRVEVMKKCPYIKRCVINHASSDETFVRIPNKQIEIVKDFLREKVKVQFSENLPAELSKIAVNDAIQVIGGPLRQDIFDVKGTVKQMSGRYAVVAVDGVGYLWKVPVKDLAKIE